MKGFWGYMKGGLILQLKAIPWLMLSPLFGAVRGAVVTAWEEIDKHDARVAAFKEKYMREYEEEIARMSGNASARD